MRLRRRARATTAPGAARSDGAHHPAAPPTARPPAAPVGLAETSAARRARTERAEAQSDLARLRRRYWSGERLLEESKTDVPWWEHADADPYAVLELLPGASLAEAAAARRQIARRCHPDLTGHRRVSDLAVRRLVAANVAYDRLRRALQPV